VIVPNLMVRDIARSVAFSRDVLGLRLRFVLGPDRVVQDDPEGGVFALLDWEGAELMLQTVESLAAELPVFAADQAPAAGGTVYFRGLAPEPALGRADPAAVVKGPVLQWYGMREAYLADPDGHVICLGVPEGATPD
jgi:catechol 2,3-dioxygenase-like lactoylglutathione lyase family enzyme